MKTLNYTQGTQIHNTLCDITLTVTMVSEKKVSMMENNLSKTWRGGKGKNRLSKLTQSRKDFEANILEGRLTII